MPSHTESIRLLLTRSPLTTRQIIDLLKISQPTASRALVDLESELVKFKVGKAIHYALRNGARRLPDIAIFQVDAAGLIRKFGLLIPVYPDGFVLQPENGNAIHSEGLPWWLFDIRPQGYLGRSFAAQYGPQLNLPARLADWPDPQALQALLVHGYDLGGNLLLGDSARNTYLAKPAPVAIAAEHKADEYARLALAAANGEAAGSSAGGEQPKFTAYATTPSGDHHVIVKFTEREPSPISERWRDLLLCEHLALTVLSQAGIAATKTAIIDHHGQRFLEIIRFDRIGGSGRCALFSLAALDAEFVGRGWAGWPEIAQQLAISGEITRDAATGANLLAAFGTLIGNTDMHNGNLSFISPQGRPYDIAPAYDMVPMGFVPRAGGGLPDTLAPAHIQAAISNPTWHQAEQLAREFLAQVMSAAGFSQRFAPCITALEQRINLASAQIARLG